MHVLPVETIAETANADKPPVVVKKYANRRLYNTESSSYITLDNLADMVRPAGISSFTTRKAATTSPAAC